MAKSKKLTNMELDGAKMGRREELRAKRNLEGRSKDGPPFFFFTAGNAVWFVVVVWLLWMKCVSRLKLNNKS